MKNLHKKIGAMVLAGMVVLGGVAVSGVNSFAASGNNRVSSLNHIKELQERKVKNIIRGRGNLLGASSDEKEINNIKNKKYKDKKWRKNQVSKVNGQCEIPLILSKVKRSPWEVIKVEWKGIYYLIEVIK